MTTNEQERAFLRYLSALENGNLDDIEAYLKQAETDETLEQMMTDYHNQETMAEKPKIITPRKYKRGQSPRWVRRIGGGLVAAVLMALVGFIGVYIGLNANTTPSIPVSDDMVNDVNNIPEIATGECYGVVLGNTITIVGNDLSMSNREIGINEPFVIEAIEPYISAMINDYPVTVRMEDIAFSNCSQQENITVYPPNYQGETCTITFDTMVLYGEETAPNVPRAESIIYEFGQPLMIWSTRNDTVEVVSRTSDGDFRAFVPENALTRTGNCTYEPLVYVPNVNADGEICEATLNAVRGNPITLEAGLDLETSMRVAFNNPLAIIVPDNQRIAQYHVVYQGIHAEMSSLDIELSDGCEAGQVVRIYPDDNPRQECDVVIDRMQLPMRELTATGEMFRNATFGYDIATLMALPNDTYQVISTDFTATIPAEEVTLSGNCGESNLLYVPPRNIDEVYWDTNINEPYWHSLVDDTTIDATNVFNSDIEVNIESMTIVEQHFENGVMFYLPVVEQIWVAYTDSEGVNHWSIHNADRSLSNVTVQTGRDYATVDETFMGLWLQTVGADERTLLRYLIGNATDDAIPHTSGYIEFEDNNITQYILLSYTGDRYTFDSRASSWHSD